MFRFNFGQVLDSPLEEEEPTLSDGHETIRIEPEPPHDPTPQEQCDEVALEDLVKTLPAAISYTPLVVRKAAGANDHPPIILPRRDLYDARFQIISEEEAVCEDEQEDDGMSVEPSRPAMVVAMTDPAMIPLPEDHRTAHDRLKDLEYLDAPSDVIPNQYEGGLKTWECSVDLVQYLAQAKPPFRGKTILEVGCGTAIPTAFILRSLLDEEPPASDQSTLLHLQDYNRSVLELVTLPNLLLSWYSSKASLRYRNTLADPAPDAGTPSELTIDGRLVDGFLTSLNDHRIHLRLSAGSWATFRPRPNDEPPFDIVLTSETIYRSANVPALLSVLRSSSARAPQKQGAMFASMPTLFGKQETPPALILVAAKVLYFGVGGSIDEFVAVASASRAKVTTVHEIKEGVGRRIMRLSFA